MGCAIASWWDRSWFCTGKLRGDAMQIRIGIARRPLRGIAGHVQLEGAGHHHDGLWPPAILEKRIFEGLGAIDKDSAMQTALVLYDPVALAVPSDHVERMRRTGGLLVVHDTFSSMD